MSLPCVCMSLVGPWVCLTAGTFKINHVQTSRKFSVLVTCAVARSSSHDSGVLYVLPVLWMTSCVHIMGQIQIHAWNQRRSQLFTVTRQVAPLTCAPGGEVRYRRLPCFCTLTFIFMLPCNHLTKLATRQLFWYTCVMHLFRVALCHVCCRYKLATLTITVRVTYVT